jgi:hypothetical protein
MLMVDTWAVEVNFRVRPALFHQRARGHSHRPFSPNQASAQARFGWIPAKWRSIAPFGYLELHTGAFLKRFPGVESA